MAIPERLDIRATIQKTSQASLKTGLILLLVVPAIAYGIGWLIRTQTTDREIPTLIWIVIGISALIGIAFIVGVVTDKRHPEQHDAVKWSEIGTPDALIAAIEGEWNSTPLDQKHICGDYILLPNWLVHVDSLTLETYPLQYFAWAYPSSKANYLNGVRTGTTHRVMIHRTDSQTPVSILTGSEAAGTEFLFALQRRAPWTFYGYGEAYYHGWHHDHSNFVGTVKERVRQARSGQNLPQPEGTLLAELTEGESPARRGAISI